MHKKLRKEKSVKKFTPLDEKEVSVDEEEDMGGIPGSINTLDMIR